MEKRLITTVLFISIFFGFISFCVAQDSNNCNNFIIPFSTAIKIDGNRSDWDNIPVVFVDAQGDNQPEGAYLPSDTTGTDLESFYIARDNEFLYLMITLYDGNPKTYEPTQYGFQANKIDDNEQPDDHLAKAGYYDNWYSGVHVRSTTGGGDIASYPIEYVKAGEKFIEWKVALPDMGVLNEKFVNVYIHTFVYPAPFYDVSDYFDGCIQLTASDQPYITELIIEGCNTGVPDQTYQSKKLSEWINSCANDSSSHGEFVSCVADLCNILKKNGLISGKNMGSIVSCAAEANIP